MQNWGGYTAPQKISNVTISKCFTDGIQLNNFATENLQIINYFTATNNITPLLFRNNNLINSNINFNNAYVANEKNAFSLLNGSQKKWDLTSSGNTNRIVEKTSAANTITRSEISISEKHCRY